jgi:putative transposase
MSRYLFIEQVATADPVQVLCRVLHVSAAGYYQWRSRTACPTPDWERAASAAFSRHAQRYGTRRLRAELHGEGHAVGRYALRTWLRHRSLRALSTRPQRPRTTVADPAAVVAANLLLGQPAPIALNQVWVGDITYLPLVGGRWCYLATWGDTCSRHVVGWYLDQQMPTELVFTALEQALTLPAWLSTLTAAVNTPAWLAAHASKKPRHWPAIAGRATPTIMPRPRPAGARSKLNCYPAAAHLPTSKKPEWR